jgi:hypothetical protein
VGDPVGKVQISANALTTLGATGKVPINHMKGANLQQVSVMEKKDGQERVKREKGAVQIFLSYAREDNKRVKKLYQNLLNAGYMPWMDKDILPGEKFELTIYRQIHLSDFFLACLSKNSVTKRGLLQKEINRALDICEGMLDDDVYLIPIRLEDCDVPERLRKFEWVNLFEKDGWTRLMRAVQAGIERRSTNSK